MPNDALEVIFHGRAGQGAKSIAQFLAEAAMEKGFYIQTWPSYGAERSGAPMVAFTRLSKKPIRTHSPIRDADAVVVIDPSLLNSVDVVSGLSKEGMLLVNYCNAEEVQKATGFKGKIIAIDAKEISMRLLGINYPNIPMLGALLRHISIVDINSVASIIRRKFIHKIGEEKTAKNIAALKEGCDKA